MAKILYLDCSAGAAGDMILGALIDAGLPLADLDRAVSALLPPGASLSAERVLRSGVSATKFRLHEPRAGAGAPPGVPPPHREGGGHHHAHTDRADAAPATAGSAAEAEPSAHTHRSLAEILSLIDRAALSEAARRRGCDLFRRLAEAEAAVHQTPVERVHLHEVGALDSVVDIVGAAFAFEWCGADRIVASPLNVGGGTVRTAHGVLPVPAPATVRLLGDAPIYSSGVPVETVTPTGALLVTAYATGYGPVPAMRIDAAGYGAGDRDLPGTPNVLRVLLGHDEAGPDTERVAVLECEVDDMNPQIFGVLLDLLYAAGALEVFYTPVQMKKNRPGTLLTVIARPELRHRLETLIFRETTSIGLRYQELTRSCLARELVSVPTPLGDVRVKVARRGGEVMNASPEFEDCARLASVHSLPVKQVLAMAIRAYLERGRQP
jgi:hypothetical protein